MSDLKDLAESVIKAFSERITNPFLGSFFLSWLVFNWEIFLVFFSGSYPPNIKIHLIKTDYINWCDGLLWPLFWSLVFILGMPYVYWLIEKMQKHAKLGRYKNNRAHIEDKAEEAKKIAQASEDTASAKEREVDAAKRVKAANEELKLQTSNAKIQANTKKNVYIDFPGYNKQINIDTDREGAILHFNLPIKSVHFIASCFNSGSGTYSVRKFNFAGDEIASFKFSEISQKREVNLDFQEPLDQVAIVQIGGSYDASEISLFNIKIETDYENEIY